MSSLSITNKRVEERLNQEFVILSMITSGGNPFCHCILQIVLSHYKNFELTDTLSMNIIPYEAPDYDQIHETMPEDASRLDNQIPIDEAYEKTVNYIGNKIVVTYNAMKNIQFMSSSQSDKLFSPLIVDIEPLIKKHFKSLRNYSLQYLAAYYQLEIQSFDLQAQNKVTALVLKDVLCRQ